MLRAMQYAATHGFVIVLRPEDAHLARDGIATKARWPRALA